MKLGYTVENGSYSDYNRKILVYNYESLNTVTNLPCVEKSALLKNKSINLLGVWKIKQLKS